MDYELARGCQQVIGTTLVLGFSSPLLEKLALVFIKVKSLV